MRQYKQAYAESKDSANNKGPEYVNYAYKNKGPQSSACTSTLRIYKQTDGGTYRVQSRTKKSRSGGRGRSPGQHKAAPAPRKEPGATPEEEEREGDAAAGSKAKAKREKRRARAAKEDKQGRGKEEKGGEGGAGEEGKGRGRTTPDRKGVTHHGLLGVSLPPVFPSVSVNQGGLQGA